MFATSQVGAVAAFAYCLAAVLGTLIVGVLAIILALIVQSFYGFIRLRHVQGEPWYFAFKFDHVLQPHRANRNGLAKFRKCAGCKKVYREYIGLTPVVVTAHPPDIIHVIASPDFERSPRMKHILDTALPGSLFSMPTDIHRRARAKFRTKFSQSLLPNFHNAMRHALTEFCQNLASVADGSTKVETHLAAKFPNVPNVVDMTSLLYTTTFRIISDVACGTNLDAATRKIFSKEADTLMLQMAVDYMLYPFSVIFKPLISKFSPLYKSRNILHAMCRELLNQRIQERRLEKPPSEPKQSFGGGDQSSDDSVRDLLDAIISVHAYDPSDDAVDAVSQTVLFTIAGSHTTNCTASWAIYELTRDENRAVLEEIRQEVDAICKEYDVEPDEMLPYEAIAKLKFIPKVWKETLRMHPTTLGIPRMSVRDVTLRGSGTYIPKGTLVMAAYGASQKDAQYFSDPERFWPSRWGDPGNPSAADRAPTGSFLPFSAGPTNCAGQFFADYEGVCLLAEILRRFSFSLPCPPSHIVSYSGWAEIAKYDPADDGSATIGVPMCVEMRFKV